jgi:fibronectin-binding autotransporter adhesin
MKKKLMSFGSLFMLSLIAILATSSVKALAANRIWDGGGADDKFSTAQNWDTDTAPVSGDHLEFPLSVTGTAPTNDMTSASFAGIDITGTGGDGGYTITGNSFTLTGDMNIAADTNDEIDNNITVSAARVITTASNSILTFQGTIDGSGSISKSGTGQLWLNGANTSYSGAITVNAGSLLAGDVGALGTNAGTTTVNANADVTYVICGVTTATIPESFTLDGSSSLTTGSAPSAKLAIFVESCTGGGGPSYDEVFGYDKANTQTTMTGNITLATTDATIGTNGTVTFTGSLNGSYHMKLMPGYAGTLVVQGSSNSTSTANGTYKADTLTTTVSDSHSGYAVLILGGNEVIITGTRGAVTVDGGILKGNGTVGVLTLTTGEVAPGQSPGVLNSGSLSFTGGALDEELGGTGAGQYDQLNVTGTVSLGAGTTLNTSLYNGFAPKGGDSFTIINNDGTDAVSGTFSGLAEGATFTVGSTVFKISYVGGTGNDVVLTVQSAPATPNTGFSLIRNNPLAVLALTTFAAGGTMFASRKHAKVNVKR